MSGAKGVQVEGLDLPDSVDPGDPVTARIDMTNTSNFISPWDDDRCSEGNTYGILVEGVVVGPYGQEHVGTSVCAKQHDIVAAYEATSEVTFDVPERDGTHRYEAFVRTVETGATSSRVSGSINVYADEEDAPEEDEEDDDNNDAGLPDWWPFGEDADRTQAILGVVLVVAAMYAAGNLFDVGIGYGGSA